ncbi:MAG: hypothetical protein V3T64_04255, partial [Myxococcota bacterium]
MALTVGELSIELEASTKEFEERLKRADKALDDTAENAEKATQRIEVSISGLADAVADLATAFALLNPARSGGGLLRLASFIPGLRVAVLGLTAAFAGFRLFRLSQEGLQLSASFEQIEISLGVLTGSAANARDVLREVNEIVLATPFGLEQLANVSRSLAVVFGDNTAAISEFTAITADIAAISGRPVEQIGSQLQRAISSGLASAEVLRESGITQLLLEVSGAADSAALSGQDLLDAFRALTSEGGRGFRAAALQAVSLAGAISNAEIAAQNFARALGDALSPAQTSRALNTQAAFGNLEKTIRGLAPTLELITGIFARFVNTIVNIGVVLATTLGFALGTVQFLFAGFAVSVALAVVGVEAFATSLALLAVAFDQLVRGNTAEAARIIREFDIGELSSVRFLDAALENLDETATASNQTVNALGGSLATIGRAFLEDAEAVGINTDGLLENTDARARSKAEIEASASAAQKAALDQLALAAAHTKALDTFGNVTGIQREINAIDLEIARLGILVQGIGDVTRFEEQRTAALQARVRLAERLAAAEQNLPAVLAAINAQIAAISEIDPQRGVQAARDFSNALTGAGADPTAQIRAAAEVLQTLREEQAERDRAIRTAAIEDETRQRKQAATTLSQIVQRAEDARLSDFGRQIAALDRQIVLARELATLSGDQESGARAVLALQLERERVADAEEDALQATAEATDRIVQAQARLPEVLANVREQIAKLGELDPEAAAEFSRRLAEGLDRAGEDTELAERVAGDIAQKVLATTTEVAPTIAAQLAGRIGEALNAVFNGEAVNFGQVIGDVLLTSATQALEEAFSKTAKLLRELMTKAFEEAGKILGAVLSSATDTLGGALSGIFGQGGILSGIGDIFGEGGALSGIGGFFDLDKAQAKAFGNVAVGVLGAGIQALTRDDAITSSAANIRSAIDSAQRVRGIVAGPTSIGIAQVDRGIRDAFLPTEALLVRIERNTRTTAEVVSP